MGWNGSKALKHAFRDAPCGCAMAERAKRAGNAEQVATGEAFADAWRCPRRGSSLRKTPEHLPGNCRRTIERVERLTDAHGCATCPMFYTRLPHVGEIALLRNRREQHVLALTDPHLDAIQLDCIEAIDVGYAARMGHEADEREAEAESKRVAADHAAIDGAVGSIGKRR